MLYTSMSASYTSQTYEISEWHVAALQDTDSWLPVGRVHYRDPQQSSEIRVFICGAVFHSMTLLTL